MKHHHASVNLCGPRVLLLYLKVCLFIMVETHGLCFSPYPPLNHHMLKNILNTCLLIWYISSVQVPVQEDSLHQREEQLLPEKCEARLCQEELPLGLPLGAGNLDWNCNSRSTNAM